MSLAKRLFLKSRSINHRVRDTFWSGAWPQEAPGGPRMFRECLGGPRRPQESPGGPRTSQDVPEGFRRPQKAPGGPRNAQEARGGPRMFDGHQLAAARCKRSSSLRSRSVRTAVGRHWRVDSQRNRAQRTSAQHGKSQVSTARRSRAPGTVHRRRYLQHRKCPPPNSVS